MSPAGLSRPKLNPNATVGVNWNFGEIASWPGCGGGSAARLPAKDVREFRRPTAECSAAGHAHVAGEGGAAVAAVDDEIVPLGLAGDRLVDCRVQQIVGL